jgi:hypothetical protein
MWEDEPFLHINELNNAAGGLMTLQNYLLTNLHRLASGQDENFITETFVYVLRILISNEPKAASLILRAITDGFINVSTDEINSVDIKTQVTTESGKPDISISTDDHLVYIEVKVDSGFGHCQLERYRSQLQRSGIINTKLITLTRYQFIDYPSCEAPDFSLRWHILPDLLSNLTIKDKVTLYVISEFINLLRIRGLAMEKVGWEIISGVKSFIALIDMIAEALAAKKVSIHRNSPAQDWRGYYLENKTFFIGIYYDTPELVVLNTEVTLSGKAPKEVTLGKLTGGGWRNELDLTSEDVHFFARSRASQVQCLERFIEESLKYGKSLIDPVA